jgi:hypothetical protein
MIPWTAELPDRVQLRAEILADRYARAKVRRAHLATALLELMHIQTKLGASAYHAERSEGQKPLTHNLEAIIPAGLWRNGECVDERIRYLLLPDDAALPSLVPGHWSPVAAWPLLVKGLSLALAVSAANVVSVHYNALALLPATPVALRVLLHL